MATLLNIQEGAALTHEGRANKMRKTWGKNTIVWFARGFSVMVYGKDAEVMADVCNLPVEYDAELLQSYGNFPTLSEYIYRPKLVKAGYKICILRD